MWGFHLWCGRFPPVRAEQVPVEALGSWCVVELSELGAGQEEAGAEQGKTLGGFSAVTQTVAVKLTKHNMRISCCLVSLAQVLVATLAAAAATLIRIR